MYKLFKIAVCWIWVSTLAHPFKSLNQLFNATLSCIVDSCSWPSILGLVINVNSISPCIDSGNPNFYDVDGSISDIGALPYIVSCSIIGDINNDIQVNVLDIVDLVNCVLLNECYECSDLNNDGIVNILDIIDIVNIIIN